MNSDKELYVVGIGASAGGLNAIQELFNHMPTDTGMAFIVIQHLSPDFKSLMPELLAKYTKMKIFTAEDKQEIKPNCIYLNQRNKNLHIKGNQLYLLDKGPKHNLNLPIDIFFHTLGEEFKERSIGIIVSGTGSDGSRGIKTIKEAGGTLIVQDPATAQFDGMPNSAIATNLVDYILPPEKFYKVLFKYPNKRILLSDVVDSQSNDVLFFNILEEVSKFSGIDFRLYKKNTLLRRLEKRMNVNNIEELYDYYTYIKSNKKEIEILKLDFLIGVTSFFRDTEAFESLKKKVIPEICNHKKDSECIRIWIPGCSSGEEVYSVAILFDDYIRFHRLNLDFKIFATDVDQRAINSAGTGNFNINNANEIEKQYFETYFVKSADKIQIIKRIREKIVFSIHNVLKDPPFIRMDLITCRNMLIYFDHKAQNHTLSNFQFSLDKYGYLFLGNSESLGAVSKLFKVIDSKWKIFQNISETQKITNQVNPVNKISTYNFKSSEKHIVSPEFRFKENPESTFHKYLSKKHSPASIFIDKDFNILFIKGNAGKRLSHSEGIFERNLLKMVHPEIASVIRNGVRKLEKHKKDILIKNIVNAVDEDVFTFDLSFHNPNPNNNLDNVYLLQFSEEKKANKEELLVYKNLPIDEISKERFEDLENELNTTKTALKNAVEELETSNEELQSSNEELMASNEELQSTNEELQSVNEELYTVNSELQEKNKELNWINDDVTNLLENTEIGTLFLDKDLRIRKFTPALKQLFNLDKVDEGRPISSFAANFNEKTRIAIINDSKTVLKKLIVIEKEISDLDGNTYLKRVSPFITADKKIDGVVISFVSINKIKEIQQELSETENRYQKLFTNLNEGFVHSKIITDNEENPINWEYIAVNPAFEKQTGLKAATIVGKRLEITPSIKEEHIQRLAIYAETALTGKEQFIEYYSKNLNKHYNIHIFSPKKGEFAATFSDVTNIKETEILAKRNSQLLEASQAITKVGGWELDLVTNNLYWTAETYRIHETSPEKFNPTVDAGVNFFLPKSKVQIVEALKEAIEHGKGYDLELETYTTKGNKIDVRTTCEVTLLDGKPIKLTGIFQDITELNKKEKALVKMESHLKDVQQISKIGSWFLDTETNEVVWTEELYTIYGFDPKKPLPPLHEQKKLFTDESWEKLSKAIANTKKTGIPYEIELRTIQADGTNGWLWAKGEATKEADGKIIGLWGAVQDITDSKNLLEEIKFEKEFSQKITNSSSSGVYIYDVIKSTNVFVNKQYKKILGYTMQEVNAMNNDAFMSLFHPDDLEAVQKHQEKILSKEENCNIEYRFKHKQGHWVWCFSVDSPFSYDKQGNITSFIGVFIDITEKKENEQELRHALKAAETANSYKNQFLANMSHEIRTPMNGILGFADLLKGENLISEKRNKYIEIIKRSSNQLLNLINDIIDISKIEAKELKLIMKACNLNALLSHLESTYSEIKKQKRKEHILIFGNINEKYNGLTIKTDPLRLEQVFINLINNALKFSENGTIEFGFEIIDHQISFYVKDEGIGIPKDKIEKIFNRFEQLKQNDPGKNEGTGLGLAISKGIVDLFGGEFKVTSTVGKGTTIRFSFPFNVLESATEEASNTPNSDFKTFLNNKTILLAEDDTTNTEYFKALFLDTPLKVLYATNGKEAVQLYVENPEIDVVLMDIRMPILDGVEAAQLILEKDKKAKIIAQTANAMASDAKKYLERGFIDYIPKPINKEELLKKIAKLFV